MQVIDVKATPGSIYVSSTTEFLDGSTTGAADLQTALGDTSSVQALFPSSVYGTVIVTSVSTESVSNPSKPDSFIDATVLNFCLQQVLSFYLLQVEWRNLDFAVRLLSC